MPGNDRSQTVQRRCGLVRQNDVGCSPALPRKSIALEMQPRRYVVLMLSLAMPHSEDAAPHAFQVAEIHEASDVVASQPESSRLRCGYIPALLRSRFKHGV